MQPPAIFWSIAISCFEPWKSEISGAGARGQRAVVRDAVAVERAGRVRPTEDEGARREAGRDLAGREHAGRDGRAGGEDRQHDDADPDASHPPPARRRQAPFRGCLELVAEPGEVAAGLVRGHRVVSLGLTGVEAAGAGAAPSEARSDASPRWARTRAAPGVIARPCATSA